MAAGYVTGKADALDQTLEEFFFDDGTVWPAAPLPIALRDIAVELIDTLVCFWDTLTYPIAHNCHQYYQWHNVVWPQVFHSYRLTAKPIFTTLQTGGKSVPAGLTPAAWHTSWLTIWACNLAQVSVEAEVYALTAGQRRGMLAQLLDHMLAAMRTVLGDHLKGLPLYSLWAFLKTAWMHIGIVCASAHSCRGWPAK